MRNTIKNKTAMTLAKLGLGALAALSLVGCGSQAPMADAAVGKSTAGIAPYEMYGSVNMHKQANATPARSSQGENLRAMSGPAGHRNEITLPAGRPVVVEKFELKEIDKSVWKDGVVLEAEIDPDIMDY